MHIKYDPILKLGAAFAASVGLLLGASMSEAQTRLTIGVSDTGGSFYPISVGMSQILNRHGPSIQSTVVTTGGSLASIRQLTAGEVDFAFGTFDAGVGAYHGTGLFANEPPDPNLRYFSPLFTSFGFFISFDPAYKDLHDLKDVTIAIGEAGSSVGIIGQAILKGVGLERDTDYRALEVGGGDALDALREGRAEVAFLGATPGQATIQEVTTTEDVTFITYPEDRYEQILAELAAANVGRPLLPVAAGTFRGMDADYMASAGTTAAFVSASMDEELAYHLTKAWWDNIGEVAEIHPLGRALDISVVKEQAGDMPLHPGAARYYIEKGIIDRDPFGG